MEEAAALYLVLKLFVNLVVFRARSEDPARV